MCHSSGKLKSWMGILCMKQLRKYNSQVNMFEEVNLISMLHICDYSVFLINAFEEKNNI